MKTVTYYEVRPDRFPTARIQVLERPGDLAVFTHMFPLTERFRRYPWFFEGAVCAIPRMSPSAARTVTKKEIDQ